MPLSKKRMRERKRADRKSNLTDTNVKPSDEYILGALNSGMINSNADTVRIEFR